MFGAAVCTVPVSAEVGVSAESAILIEKESGRVLYSKNCDKKLPMASTTKIMTAAVALDKFGDRLDEAIQISDNAAAWKARVCICKAAKR